jgi:hypothetical protein
VFGADKTKVTITGSKHDMQYYKDIPIWSLYGENITVADNNDHLRLVVSGLDEEQKNVDKNILETRNSLFALLGKAFSYKCKISPTTQANMEHLLQAIPEVRTSCLTNQASGYEICHFVSSYHPNRLPEIEQIFTNCNNLLPSR